jgi:hypothetical protein
MRSPKREKENGRVTKQNIMMGLKVILEAVLKRVIQMLANRSNGARMALRKRRKIRSIFNAGIAQNMDILLLSVNGLRAKEGMMKQGWLRKMSLKKNKYC